MIGNGAPMHIQPPLDEVRAHYDDWNASCRDADFDAIEPEIRVRAERVIEVLGARTKPPVDILEIGCGTGWLSQRLRAFGPVTGIDLSPRAIEIAQARGLDAHFVADDFLAHPFEPAAYDVALLIETLFYVQDQAAVMEKTASLLRPGGLLVLTCINEFVYTRRSDIGPPKPGQPRHWLSIGAMRRLLAPRFRVEAISTIDPRGDRGILRLVNSHKVNAALGRVFTDAAVRRAKERLGWGAGVVMVATRRD